MKHYMLILFIIHQFFSIAKADEYNKEFMLTGGLEEKIANLGPGCRIKLNIPIGAEFWQWYQSNLHRGFAGFSIGKFYKFSNDGEWAFDFKCYQTSDKNFQEIWEDISPENYVNFRIEAGRRKFTDDEGVTYSSVQSINAEGWTLTYDDTTGEERFRLRHLWYCVKAKESAICGSSDIGYIDFINNKKNIDIPSYAFRILESIEFLEDAPPN